MSTFRPVVTSSGDIEVHVLEDISIKFSPAVGVPTFAGRTLKFEVLDYGISIALVAHPTNADGKLVAVTVGQLAGVPGISRFAVVDRTGGISDTLWSGKMERYS